MLLKMQRKKLLLLFKLEMSIPKKIFLTKTLMKKFGALLTPTRTLFHGNTEEMKKPTQLTDGPIHQADLLFLKMLTPKKISQTRILMKKSGDSLTLIKTLFHGNTEEMKKLTQLTDGPTLQADLLFHKTSTPRKISPIRILMKRFGDSLMPTRTLSHGNIEEMRKLIQPTDGLIHQVDSLSPKESTTRKTFLIRTLMRKYGDSSMPIKILFHGNIEETKKLIQLMVGLTHQVDSH